MQHSEHLGGDLVPGPAGAPSLAQDLAAQARALHASYRQRDLRLFVAFWWPRLLLVVLGGCLGAVLAVIGVYLPLIVLGVLVAPIVAVLVVRRVDLGWIVLGICASPLIPPAFTAKSLTFYPVELVLVLLLVAVLVRAVFHIRDFVVPSFWMLWPQFALFALAIVSEILIQVTWVHQVPRKLNSQPVIYSELLGVAMFATPLLIVLATTAALSGRERWIVRMEHVLLALAGVAALIVCIEFKRIGADVYAFRYTEPSIFFMRLGALAQFLAVGAMLAYARALFAQRWRARLAYGALLVLCVAAVYVTLENARWIAIAVALVVMTFVYSRKAFAWCCAACIPLSPVAYLIVQKLVEVKGARDVNRLSVWSDMIRIWSKRPVFGVGPGNVWPFDQVFTQLPLALRNLNSTGLGVAHNGVLQMLVEVGPLGVVCYYASAVVVVIAAWRLYQRATGPDQRADRVLALTCLGLTFGSLAGDFVSGGFFLPPAQVGGFDDLPRIFATWILFGMLMYKDQLWRVGRRVARVAAWVRPPAVPVS